MHAELFEELMLECAKGNVYYRDLDGLRLFCYTQHVQFSNCWTPAICKARGLIFDIETKQIVSQGFPKFFNLEQWFPPEHSLFANKEEAAAYEQARQEVLVSFIQGKLVGEVSNKEDGSLIHAFRWKQKLYVHTKGSWEGTQIDLAKELLQKQGFGWGTEQILKNTIFLFELVGPDNKIVLNYSENKLVLLNVYERLQDGTFKEVLDRTQIHRPFRFGFQVVPLIKSLKKDDTGLEGVVVLYKGYRFKIKTSWYLALHKALANITERNMFECFVQWKFHNADHLALHAPDEFHALIQNTFDQYVLNYHVFFNETLELTYAFFEEFGRLPLDKRKDRRKELGKTRPDLHPYLNAIQYRDYDLLIQTIQKQWIKRESQNF